MTLQIKMRYEAPPQALERWNPNIKAATKEGEGTINIYSTIGEYGDGTGMTAKIVSSILRKTEGNISVNINSPGGDFFEGLAIYNLLKEHDKTVNINVLGLAGSAASIIAMAGDNVSIAEAGFFMIHNAWTIGIGNKNDMYKIADTLTKFDESMKDVYKSRTGMDDKKIIKMMNEETWINGVEAVDMGFADSILGSDDIVIEKDDNENYNSALRKLDVALAKAGMPRSERRAMLKNLIGTPGATSEPTPSAGGFSEALSKLLEIVTN